MFLASRWSVLEKTLDNDSVRMFEASKTRIYIRGLLCDLIGNKEIYQNRP